jgi:hypothetical protein
MAFNGSGVFARIHNWITDRNAGTKIRADRMDAEMDGMATGLSNTICRDGQSTVSSHIPFNNKKITGLADAAADTDAVNRQTGDARWMQASIYDANTILKADSDNTPAALTVAEQRLVGRITAGVITALTAAQVRTLLNVADGATANANAAAVPFTPAGNLVADDVQEALQELDTEKEGADTDIVKSDVTKAFTAGYTATVSDKGTISSGSVKPAPGTSEQNFIEFVNGGAFTLTAPDAAGSYTGIIDVENNASAGAVTESGWTQVDGDPWDTTNGSKFRAYYSKGVGGTHLNVKKLV